MTHFSSEPFLKINQLIEAKEGGEVSVQTVASEIDRLWHTLDADEQLAANKWLTANFTDDGR